LGDGREDVPNDWFAAEVISGDAEVGAMERVQVAPFPLLVAVGLITPLIPWHLNEASKWHS
jgi:hypothetical protein